MKHQEKPIVIIKKRKHSGHGGGHGSWKIAYADFMTAMMAFFLVMWLISIASPAQLAQIADYFRTPLAAAISGGPNLTENSSPVPNNGEGIMNRGDVKQNQAQPNDLEKLQKEMDKLSDMKRLKKLHGDLDQLIEANPELRALRPHLRIDMVKEGLRIQIIDSKNRPMFRLGSTDVEPYMREILRAIAPVLNTIPNKITISGHTDDLPYASGERSYSNWELSADRANASRRELVGGGLDDGKVLRVIGMSSTMNIAHQADDPLNRRISLVVLNKEAEQEILQNNTESKNTPLRELKNNKTSNNMATEQTATEPVTTKPKTAEPVTTEPVTTEPAATEPVTSEPVTTVPSVPMTPSAPVQWDADAPAADSNVTVPVGSSLSVVPPATDSAAATPAAPAAQPATR